MRMRMRMRGLELVMVVGLVLCCCCEESGVEAGFPTVATLSPTTIKPTTSIPTTSIPTTSSPTAKPVTSSPTTSSPTTSSPTTSSPTTSSPTTSSPTTSSPTTPSPTTSSPTTSSPTTPSPTTSIPTTASPTTSSPTTQTPTTSSPTNKPSTPSPTTSSPTTSSPTTSSPTTSSPTTSSPTTSSPTTPSPTTSSPTTSSPTTQTPTTSSPTLKPTTSSPTTSSPTTPSPTTSSPTTSSPTTSSPTTSSPTTSSPTTSSPTNRPTTSSPTTSSPTTASPTTGSPTFLPTKKPTTMSPTASPSDHPTTQNPTAAPTTAQPTALPTQSPTVTIFNTWSSCSPFRYPDCGIGTKVASGSFCECLYCPTGTYKISNGVNALCSVCGGPSYYCPESLSLPLTPGAGNCTYWDYPGPSTFNPYLAYTQYFVNVLVSGISTSLSNLAGSNVWGTERYGFLRSLRNAQGECGYLTSSLSVLNVSAVFPSVAYGQIPLTNTGFLPVNITIIAPAFCSFLDIQTLDPVTTNYVIPGYSSHTLEIQVATDSIPNSAIQVVSTDLKYTAFSVIISWGQYWTQDNSVIGSNGQQIEIAMRAEIHSGTLVISPDSLSVVLQTGSVDSRSISIYNVLATNQSWAMQPIEYLGTPTGWVSTDVTEGSMNPSCICEIQATKCEGTAPDESDSFTDNMNVVFNATGLIVNTYAAKISILASSGGSVTIPLTLTVTPGPLSPTMTTWAWIAPTTASDIRTSEQSSLAIFPQDYLGSPTTFANGLSSTSIYFNVEWFLISGVCPGSCSGSTQALYSDQGWIAQIQFPAAGINGNIYGINILFNGTTPIKGVPYNDVIVNPVDCFSYDSNSIPSTYGESCICNTGFGIESTTGYYVTCGQCKPGTYGDGTSPCNTCPAGKYQDAVGKASCKTCPSVAYQPSSDQSSCEACPPGTLVNATGLGGTACEKCPQGLVALAGETVCTSCGSDALEPSADQSSCIYCLGGFAVNATGSGSPNCEKCPAGKYAAVGDAQCEFCGSLAQEPSTDQSSCVLCKAGSVSGESGQCEQCPTGKYASTGSTECMFCESFAYIPSSDQSSCVLCPLGHAVNASGIVNLEECDPCPVGKYVAKGNATCEFCGSLAQEPSADQSSCVYCPAGSVAGESGVCEQCPVGKYASTGSTECMFCESFAYIPSSDQSSCVLCPLGHAVNASGEFNLAQCDPCPVGKYVAKGNATCEFCDSLAQEPSADQSSCVYCPAGSVAGESGVCEQCPVGKYASTGSTECMFCESFAYIPSSDQSSCVLCPPGHVVNATGEVNLDQCDACPIGKYVAKGGSICESCGSLAQEPSSDQSSCVYCSAGFVVNAAGGTLGQCEQCPAGKYAASGSTECMYCESFAYVPSADQSSCVLCPPGHAVNATGQGNLAQCELCPIGKYVSSGGTECMSCDSYAFEPSADQSSCVLCPAGYVVDAAGGTYGLCEQCPLGYYAETNATSCSRCQDYIHTPNDARTACIPCGTGEYVPVDSPFWLCTACPSDCLVRADPTDAEAYYCACNPTLMGVRNPDGSVSCEPCPVGAYCAYRFEDDLLPLDGYWQVPWEKNTFVLCRSEVSCPGVVVNNDAELLDDALMASRLQNYSNYVAKATETNSYCAGSQLCEKGYAGPLCYNCDIGYTRVGDSNCSPCIERDWMIAAVVLGLLLAAVIVIYIIHKTIVLTERDSDEVLFIKVLTSHLQLVSMSASFRITWPAWLMQVFNVMNLVSSAGQTLFSLDCLLNHNTTEGASCPSSVNTSSLANMKNGVYDPTRPLTFFLEALFMASVPVFFAVCSGLFWYGLYMDWKIFKDIRKGKSMFNFFVISNVIVLFLLYPTLTKYSLGFFSCSYEEMDGVQFLEADFNVQCWGATHLAWALTLGITMLCVFAIGVPAFSLYYLHHNVGKLSKYKEIYGFVYQGYREQVYYWEVIIMLRKFAFAFIAVVIRPYGVQIQAYLGILVLIIALELQAYVHPFTKWNINFAETLGLFASFSTLFFGLFMVSDDINQNGPVPIYLASFIVIANAIFLIYVLYNLYVISFLSDDPESRIIRRLRGLGDRIEKMNEGKSAIPEFHHMFQRRMSLGMGVAPASPDGEKEKEKAKKLASNRFSKKFGLGSKSSAVSTEVDAHASITKEQQLAHEQGMHEFSIEHSKEQGIVVHAVPVAVQIPKQEKKVPKNFLAVNKGGDKRPDSASFDSGPMPSSSPPTTSTTLMRQSSSNHRSFSEESSRPKSTRAAAASFGSPLKSVPSLGSPLKSPSKSGRTLPQPPDTSSLDQ